MKLLTLFALLFLTSFGPENPKLSEVRGVYLQSATDKHSAGMLSLMLDRIDTNSSPVLMCYKGASEMIKARYLTNPFNKLSAFKRGRILIEGAIRRDTMDIEMRFIRFSIQSNLPEMLGYRHSMVNDKRFLLDKVNGLTDIDLKKMVINYLADPKYCTEEEIKQLK